jgi:hypothetical protein
MQPFEKRGKKRSRKAAGESHPAEESANYPSQDNYLSYRDEKELVDYEPESPLKYLSDEAEISPDFNGLPAHGDDPATNIESMSNIPAFSADDSNMRSRRRSQI